jgi:hypothetical protein
LGSVYFRWRLATYPSSVSLRIEKLIAFPEAFSRSAIAEGKWLRHIALAILNIKYFLLAKLKKESVHKPYSERFTESDRTGISASSP